MPPSGEALVVARWCGWQVKSNGTPLTRTEEESRRHLSILLARKLQINSETHRADLELQVGHAVRQVPANAIDWVPRYVVFGNKFPIL